MSLKHHKHQVLAILLENLNNPQPQLVPTSTIAGQMNIRISELQKILKAMDGLGVIQTDPDLEYNLITIKGLQYLERHKLILQRPETYASTTLQTQ